MSEPILLDGIEIYTWTVQPEYFGDCIINFITMIGDVCYASVVYKPKFEEFNTYLVMKSEEERAVISGYRSWKPKEESCLFEANWLIRFFEDLAVKQDCDDMRFMLELNGSALKSLCNGIKEKDNV